MTEPLMDLFPVTSAPAAAAAEMVLPLHDRDREKTRSLEDEKPPLGGDRLTVPPHHGMSNDGDYRSRLSSSSQINLPPNWIAYIHPSGWKYYYNPSQRLVTDFTLDMKVGQDEFDRAYQNEVEKDGGYLVVVPDGWEKWIDTGIGGSERMYVNHNLRKAISERPTPSRCPSPMKTEEDRSDEEWRDILKEEAAYWSFMTAHPCHASLPAEAEKEARAQLTFFAADRMLNPEDSVAPFSKDTSKELLETLQSLSDDSGDFDIGVGKHVKTWIVSRLMERIVDERVRQQYGHYKARAYLKRGRLAKKYEEVYLPWPVEMLLLIIMTFLCFGAPFSYLRRINEFFSSPLGRTETISEKWRKFVDENVDDWTDTNLVAAVLVSGAVALVAIPGIDAASRTLAFLATLSALASLIAGLLNSWQHSHESHSSIELTIILDFFTQALRPIHTFKVLAIILSLPMAFLGWATILFTLAIVVLSWRGLDVTFVQNVGDVMSYSDAGEFKFSRATAWVTTGSVLGLAFGIFWSFFFFMRVWSPPSRPKKKVPLV